MITQNDLDIENLSYTKKDFGQIYPELLDLAKQLSSKWDPENTNESDPGIVLLKLAAFIADKNNYNIDKNILEQFLTSCTQDTSMNRLCELIGYNRHYYRSATTRISFRYTGKLNDTSAQTSSVSYYSAFSINALGDTPTTFKTEDGIIYTLLENIGDITEDNRLVTGKLAIEGELNQLTVLGNDTIQLQNLDSNNRIYFPDVEVAENGIIINGEYYTSTNTSAWRRVDNLNDQPLQSKVFKFGYDSEKGFPYLQFPEDISTLMGEGLTIKYIISKGTLGKVSQGDLSTFDAISITAGGSVQSGMSLDEGTYVIVNSSSIGAEDPETLTESYNAAKKVVGTFETLVSAQDYSNYLNNYTDDSNNKVVSNVVATDIRTDPYYSTTIFSRNPLGGTQSYYKTELALTKAQNASFYITLHGFTPVNKDINTKLTYETTYSNITATDVIEAETDIAEVKSIAQFVKTPDNFNVVLGNYTLNANITPTYKVNLSEEQEIINNVKTALYENFNSQKLDFGEEIPYDSLVEVIQNSDERIKTVSLMEPEINYTYKTISDETPKPLTAAADNALIDFVAENIIAGAMPLYYEDTSFNYDYNMTDIKDPVTLRGVRAAFDIAANTERTLNEHEAVQIITDSFVTKLTYPVGVYYSFEAGDASSLPQANTPYTLQEGDVLYIAYTDSSDVAQFKTYTKKSKDYTTFIPSFTMTNCAHSGKIGGGDSKNASKFLDKDGNVVEGATADNPGEAICLYYLGTKEQIEMVTRNSYELPKRSKAFWLIQPRVANNGSISNEKGALIFTKIDSNYTYILEENEYFIYPSDDLLSINLCGPGTKLLLKTEVESSTDSITINRSSNTAIDLTELMDATEDGDVGTFENAFAWETLSPQYSIEVVETSITTIAEGDKILSDTALSSNWVPLTSKTINGTTYASNQNGLARTVASFTCSSDEPYAKPSGWALTFYNSAGNSMSDIGALIQTSAEVDSYNDMIFLGTLQYVTKGSTLQPKTDENDNYVYEYNCKMQSYTKQDYKDTSSTISTIYDLICAILGAGATTNSRDEYVFTVAQIRKQGENVPNSLNIGFSEGSCKINVFDTHSGETHLLKNNASIDLTAFKTGGDAESSDALYISKPKNLALQSYLEDIDADFKNAVIEKVEEETTYDYLGEKNTYKYISSYTPLYSFFDENNIYNKFTIAKIDFDSSKFNVIGGNLKYVKN